MMTVDYGQQIKDYQDIEKVLIKILSTELKIPTHRISVDDQFERYGIDSISAMTLTAKLEERFGRLSKTLFFQYTSISTLSDYLHKKVNNEDPDESVASDPPLSIHGEQGQEEQGQEEQGQEEQGQEEQGQDVQGQEEQNTFGLVSADTDRTDSKRNAQHDQRVEQVGLKTFVRKKPAFTLPSKAGQTNIAPAKEEKVKAVIEQRSVKESRSMDIAIIGMSGRFPGASSVQDFWALLEKGTDCVTEIPKERWALSDFYAEDKDGESTSYSKWGSFIKDVDKFDSLFFNIPPRDAILMDPQERIFMEVVWELLESSGYTRDAITKKFDSKVGLYAGAMYQNYRNYHSDARTNAITSVGSYSSMVNRVSHYFDFRGPSIAIDTMCSTTITCLRMACEGLVRGDSKMAIAGAANLSLHPNKYIGLSQGQMLGSHSNSRSFSEGDGYIPAECIGAILLKPASEAVKDGDNILGVIKSIAINHNGRSNAYSVPSLPAQTDVINTCFDQAGIDRASIGYIESAANGSALGDPIEMAALNAVFSGADLQGEKIPVGSVKTNIGHAEAASGISQLAKVLMQFKHSEMAPSLINGVNPDLGLDSKILELCDSKRQWEAAVTPSASNRPKRSLITSFGAGGSNSAMIVDEYVSAEVYTGAEQSVSESDTPKLFVFSARNRERLAAVAQSYARFLTVEGQSVSLVAIASALAHHREGMEYRLAIVAPNREALATKLIEFTQSNSDSESLDGVYVGDSEQGLSDIDRLLSIDQQGLVITTFIEKGELSAIAELWVKGMSIPWDQLMSESKQTAHLLPNYPFKKVHHWVDIKSREGANSLAQTTQERRPSVQTNVAPNDPQTKIIESPNDYVQNYILGFIGRELKLNTEEIGFDSNLRKLGVDSITIMRFVRSMREEFGVNISVSKLSDISTIREFTSYICSLDNVDGLFNKLIADDYDVDIDSSVSLSTKIDVALSGFDPSTNSIDDLIDMVDSL